MDENNPNPRKRFGRTSLGIGTLQAISIIKTSAELATLGALFSFIAKAYESEPARWVSVALIVSLGMFLTVHILRWSFRFVIPSSKYFVPALIASAAISLATTITLQKKVMFPVIAAIERQVSATPPVTTLRDGPVPSGSPVLPKQDTAAPIPPSVQTPQAVVAPAPSAPPSVDPIRSSTPEARKPN